MLVAAATGTPWPPGGTTMCEGSYSSKLSNYTCTWNTYMHTTSPLFDGDQTALDR